MFVFRLVAFCLALGLGTSFAAVSFGDHHREHPMPRVDLGYAVAVRPGERVTVKGSFHANNENAIQIYNQGNGALVEVWNNLEVANGEWASPMNSGDSTIIYLIVSRHKNGGANAHSPWIISNFRVLDDAKSESAVTIGFEDSSDGDFNDATAFVTWF